MSSPVLRDGLARAADAPVRSGWLEAGAVASYLYGPEGYVEGGVHLRPGLSVFGKGYVNPRDYGVLAGLRYNFDF